MDDFGFKSILRLSSPHHCVLDLHLTVMQFQDPWNSWSPVSLCSFGCCIWGRVTESRVLLQVPAESFGMKGFLSLCFGVRLLTSGVAHRGHWWALARPAGSRLPPLQDTHEDHDTSTENADESNHDPQFEPIVSLPEQEIKTLEEDEEELFKM